jgi:hypothetical protein
MARRELFREYFAAFKASGCGGWADKTTATRTKRFGDSSDQRSFRANNGQVGSNRLGEACKTGRVIYIGRDSHGDFADSGVTRRAEELRGVWTARKFPCEGVFPAPRADYKDSHDAAIV